MVEKHPFMVVFAEFDVTYIHKSDGGYKKDFFGGENERLYSAGKDISILYPEFRQISVQYNPGFETGHWLFCNILLGDIIMCRC